MALWTPGWVRRVTDLSSMDRANCPERGPRTAGAGPGYSGPPSGRRRPPAIPGHYSFSSWVREAADGVHIDPSQLFLNGARCSGVATHRAPEDLSAHGTIANRQGHAAFFCARAFSVDGQEGPAVKSRSGIVAVAAGAGLIALMAVVTAGSAITSRAADRSAEAVRTGAIYGDAALAVATEESLERKYRLQPGPVVRAAHTAAEDALARAMRQVTVVGGSADRQLAAVVLREERGYAAASQRLFLSADRHDPAAVTNAIDSQSVDPVSASMRAQVVKAADRHKTAALEAATSVRHVGDIVLILDIATLLAGIALIIRTAAALTRNQRDLRSESDHNHYQALHDSLTNLPNRTLFQDRTGVALRAAARSGASVAVMLLDLNRFKEVNDTLGHQSGDDLLLQVAGRLTAVLRDADSVARLGGDEFAILLPVSGWDNAVAAAERIGAALGGPFMLQDVALDVEASIGIAVAEPGDDVETVLRHADVAMYEAKAEHHPFARYEPSRDSNNLSRLVLLGDLRRAIIAGQMTLHYQPKFNTKTGVVSSVEALVRWEHPTLGLLEPDAFVPIAETTAVIHPLTTEVLRLALIQARRWADNGHPMAVAVNISVRSLLDATFPAQVQTLLDTYGVDPHLLDLELTETAIMTDRGLALSVLQALDDMGVALSIDDFGTGYSSMSYLKSLPVRELKIDRSFVMGMNSDPDSAVIVRSTIELGHNLGMTVVAEGVEDTTAQQALTALGCDLLQGYHICRPTSAAGLDSWLEAHNALRGVTSATWPTSHGLTDEP